MNRAGLIGRACAAFVVIAFAGSASAQNALQPIKRTPASAAAIAKATHGFIAAQPKGSLTTGGVYRSDSGEHRGGGRGGATQNPGDLTYQGGSVIPYATQHIVYLFPNGSACATPGCWGNIPQFLSDLNRSPFIHIADQYVGANDRARYPVGNQQFGLYYTLPANPLVDADMAEVAYLVESALGVSGYNHIVHIFLAPEQNVCFDTSYTICSSNYFCGYHSSVQTDIGEVIYTVEPNITNVFGCNQPASSPNGGFDAQYSVLSHEAFETVTDPNGDAWWNASNQVMFGSEIGDECQFLEFDSNGYFSSFAGQLIYLGGHPYQVQTEYNNAAHACSNQPSFF